MKRIELLAVNIEVYPESDGIKAIAINELDASGRACSQYVVRVTEEDAGKLADMLSGSKIIKATVADIPPIVDSNT